MKLLSELQVPNNKTINYAPSASDVLTARRLFWHWVPFNDRQGEE